MADVITDGVAAFRRAVDRWVKSPNPIDAHHALKAAPKVLKALDDARAELKRAPAPVSAAGIRQEIRYALAELALDHGHDDIVSVHADTVAAALAELFVKRTEPGQ